MLARAFLDDDQKNNARAAPLAIRILIAVSQPVLWVTLVMAFVWLTMRPTRHWIVRSFQHRQAVNESTGVALWRAAGDVLTQGPYLILAMLLIGGGLGVLLGGLSDALWGLAAAVLGASLAPAIFEPARCDS